MLGCICITTHLYLDKMIFNWFKCCTIAGPVLHSHNAPRPDKLVLQPFDSNTTGIESPYKSLHIITEATGDIRRRPSPVSADSTSTTSTPAPVVLSANERIGRLAESVVLTLDPSHLIRQARDLDFIGDPVDTCIRHLVEGPLSSVPGGRTMEDVLRSLNEQQLARLNKQIGARVRIAITKSLSSTEAESLVGLNEVAAEIVTEYTIETSFGLSDDPLYERMQDLLELFDILRARVGASGDEAAILLEKAQEVLAYITEGDRYARPLLF